MNAPTMYFADPPELLLVNEIGLLIHSFQDKHGGKKIINLKIDFKDEISHFWNGSEMEGIMPPY